MSAGQVDLIIEQGTTWADSFTWETASGSAVDLTGWAAKLQIRKKASASSAVLLELSTDNGGITIPNPANGTVILAVSATDTAALAFTRAAYDLKLTSPSGAVVRLIEGAITVDPEVTR